MNNYKRIENNPDHELWVKEDTALETDDSQEWINKYEEKKEFKIFWVRSILGFQILVNENNKPIKKYDCSGCVVDYQDYVKLKQKEKKEQ